MPPPPYRTEAYVGLFVLLGLGLLGWLIFHFGDFRGSRSGGYPLIVEVRDATGIRKGVPVRLGGVEIGRAQRSRVNVGGSRRPVCSRRTRTACWLTPK